MQTLTYFYTPNSIIDPKTQKVIGTIYSPRIPIRFSYNRNIFQIPVDCLVDSGSDTNLFPAQWGQAAGVNITKGIYKKIIGIGNSGVDAYTHRVKLYVGSHQISVDVDFSFGHQMPLLGRTGFFNKFSEVKFLESLRKLELIF